MTSEETSAALASVLSNLASHHDLISHPNLTNGGLANGSRPEPISLPGADSIAKTALEQELSALASRIRVLEVRANASNRPLSAGSPVENRVSNLSLAESKRDADKASHARRKSSAKDTESSLVNDLLSGRPNTPGEQQRGTTQLTDEQLASVRDHMSRQDAKIKLQKELLENLDAQLKQQRTRTAEVVNGLEHGMEDIGALKRELAKHQQANMAFQKALREIGNIVTAVANGDLSKKVLIHAKELDPEITTFKRTINKMVDQLQDFASQVTHLAKEVGTEGRLGGQASVPGVSGIWAELQDNVNYMAENLTNQVREIAVVTTAVAHGDLSRKIERPAKGEIFELQQTINIMVDQLRLFATEVTRVAQDVGTEGVLGGQAEIQGVQGMWEHLTLSVNAMANNLTSQVRDISTVTSAVAKGDLTQKVSVECKGEILQLKSTINSMVDRLATFAFEVSKVAREVGVEGRLGGQAEIEDMTGRWKEIQQNVNTMAQNLTSQVRGISEVTQAIARGDMSRKIEVDAQGEILLLKSTINDMVARLDDWSLAVKRVARDVGVDGVLGGQAEVMGIAGRWKEITADVNTMAQNLTSQVRAFADITNAANSGDFTQEITIAASGEMDELKRKINKMVSGLRESIEKNQKAREVAELANKTKSEFLANMSHEIRTPMNGIIGMTQLTLDSELTSQQRDMLNTVSNLANSLLTIIDDVLDISKIEANRMDIERIPFSLRGTVFNALKTMVVRANDRGLNLAYEVDNSTPDFVVGDSFRLRQIIVNLVGNALKFTESGEIKVGLSRAPPARTKRTDSPDSYAVLFAVSDTGIGIHGDKLNVIFETFQQADGSTTRKFGGTGLGLSISKKLVNLMGGNLWVESAYGSGSTFYFTCRFGQPDTSVNSIRASLQPYRKHTVLFIDQGNTGCADQIIDGLKQLDLIPLIVREGDEQAPPAIPSANGHAYDCVIVDCTATARRLRQVDKFKYIPIVMLSPKVSVSFKNTLEDGIASYMTTPCLPIDLGNALIPALEGRTTPSKSAHSRSFDILLAEDNTVNQKLAVKILEKYNHTVTVANNGLEAFEAVKAKMYDVVLMDVQMPVMGGFEATETIREWEKVHRTRRTPIIALTAHAMLGDRDKCLQAQMDDYLSKPLKQSHLIQTILKYATMSEAILEHQTKSRRSLILEAAQQTRDTTSNKLPTNLSSMSPELPTGSDGGREGGKASGNGSAALLSPKRPLLPARGATDRPLPLESPALFTADQDDPLDRKFFFRSTSNN